MLEHPNIKTEHKTDLHESLTHAVVMAGTAEIHVRNRTSTKTLKVSKIIYISVKKMKEKHTQKKIKCFRISTIQKSVFPPNSTI